MNKNIFINPSASIKESLKRLTKSGERCLVVVDVNKKYLGTLSDGDLRRAILKKK